MTKLTDALAIAEHEARKRMPEGRHMVSLQSCLEALRLYAEAAYDDDFDAMYDAAFTLSDEVSDLAHHTLALIPEPDEAREGTYDTEIGPWNTLDNAGRAR